MALNNASSLKGFSPETRGAREMMWTPEARRIFCWGSEGPMKEIVFIEWIAVARQRLAELSKLSKCPPGSEIQARRAVDLLSSVLDELEGAAKNSKHEEEAAYENESRFKILAETATDGIISIDDQSTILYVNPAAGQIFGYQSAEMLGKNLTYFMPERLRQFHLTSVRRYVTTGQRHIGWRAVELIGLNKSGREFPIEVSFGEDIRNGNHFFTGIVRDVTDRKRSEEALRASEQRLQAIVDNTTAIIFIKDLELRYLLVNREYERLFGVQRDQIRGKTDFDIHPHDVAETLRANDQQVIEAGGPTQFEEVVPSEESVRHYVVVKFLLRDQVNEPYAVCGIATDITALKQAQENLRLREAELAHITRVMTMGEITSSIAHEINQPLGAIVNYGNACLRFLKGGSANLAEMAAALSAIVNDANRASAIIARIRALSKKAPPQMAALQVRDVVTDILALVRHELTGRRIALKTALPADLAPVLGDRIQLQQVLLNLVINSIEAMNNVPEDRRRLFIGAQSHVSEDVSFVLITVTDSGIGLKTEDLPRLFETFYTTKAAGMGMGLSISRSIVDSHGGRLWATPNADLGATFQFTLPMQT
jgi:PAS domain S-box-containing protein